MRTIGSMLILAGLLVCNPFHIAQQVISLFILVFSQIDLVLALLKF